MNISPEVQITELQAHIQFLQNRVLILSQIGNDALNELAELKKFVDANTEKREITIESEKQ